ncbi:hypothetical protein IWX50DRAFT_244079 [Phyllosticta citricarpa]
MLRRDDAPGHLLSFSTAGAHSPTFSPAATAAADAKKTGVATRGPTPTRCAAACRHDISAMVKRPPMTKTDMTMMAARSPPEMACLGGGVAVGEAAAVDVTAGSVVVVVLPGCGVAVDVKVLVGGGAGAAVTVMMTMVDVSSSPPSVCARASAAAVVAFESRTRMGRSVRVARSMLLRDGDRMLGRMLICMEACLVWNIMQ